jgi:hypothetical protein
VPNDGIRRGMERPGRRSEGRQWNWRPQRRPQEADGRRLHTEVGPYLAMDGDRLNFLTNIHVRASHYRLSAGSTTRDRPPAREHDLPIPSTCDSLHLPTGKHRSERDGRLTEATSIESNQNERESGVALVGH